MLISSILFYAIGKYCFQFIEKIFSRSKLPLRMAARSLTRNRSYSVTGFIALGLGVLFTQFNSQFQNSLNRELGLNNRSGKIPKLFLFDIQEDQVDPIQKLLLNEGKPLDNITPWEGKLLKVKGEKYKIADNNELKKTILRMKEEIDSVTVVLI